MNEAPLSGSALPARRCRTLQVRVDRPLGAQPARCSPPRSPADHRSRRAGRPRARPGSTRRIGRRVARAHRRGPAIGTGRGTDRCAIPRAQQSDAIRKALNFLYIFLTVFGAVGLLVGAFIIFNTFTIVLAQRTRELALLRAIGASPGQVRRSVRIEAAVVGFVGGAAGVGGGIGLAVGLRAILDAVGLSLPGGSLVIAPRTVVLGIVVGTAVTFLAALVPSRHAARIPPRRGAARIGDRATGSAAPPRGHGAGHRRSGRRCPARGARVAHHEQHLLRGRRCARDLRGRVRGQPGADRSRSGGVGRADPPLSRGERAART